MVHLRPDRTSSPPPLPRIWHRILDPLMSHISYVNLINHSQQKVPGYVILNIAKGSITVELYKDASPEAVDKFLESCKKKRGIKHYVIQGGYSQELGGAEDWIQKGKANSKLDTSPKHEAFMLGTTKGKLGNQGFELFITTAPIPNLSEKLVVYGRVIKGEDVVQEIKEVDTDEHYRTKSPIGIIDIELRHKP